MAAALCAPILVAHESVVQHEPRYLLLVGVGRRARYLLLLSGFHSEFDAADMLGLVEQSALSVLCDVDRCRSTWSRAPQGNIRAPPCPLHGGPLYIFSGPIFRDAMFVYVVQSLF